jgi:hypothetical protein
MADEMTHVRVPGCACVAADEGCPVCDAPIEIYRMVCGVECVAFPDGALAPEIDFYEPSASHKATCTSCREGRSVDATTEAVRVSA